MTIHKSIYNKNYLLTETDSIQYHFKLAIKDFDEEQLKELKKAILDANFFSVKTRKKWSPDFNIDNFIDWIMLGTKSNQATKKYSNELKDGFRNRLLKIKSNKYVIEKILILTRRDQKTESYDKLLKHLNFLNNKETSVAMIEQSHKKFTEVASNTTPVASSSSSVASSSSSVASSSSSIAIASKNTSNPKTIQEPPAPVTERPEQNSPEITINNIIKSSSISESEKVEMLEAINTLSSLKNYNFSDNALEQKEGSPNLTESKIVSSKRSFQNIDNPNSSETSPARKQPMNRHPNYR
jgi:hypothetical protein